MVANASSCSALIFMIPAGMQDRGKLPRGSRNSRIVARGRRGTAKRGRRPRVSSRRITMKTRPGIAWLARTVIAAAALTFGGAPAHARITRIEIARVESPAFGGAAFGGVGTYDKLVGRAFGEIDPRDRQNAGIQDIELAPRNARGMVEYAMDIYILTPHDPARGNATIFYDAVNRGNKVALALFNFGAVGGNEPTSAGDGFLQSQGYT